MTSKKLFLPLDVNTFSTLRNNDFVYIDKTHHIYKLFEERGSYFFLARPRRFGKSLLLSTLKELFEGNKQLFEGLWISNADYEWKYHPIIELDFSIIPSATKEELINSLNWRLDEIARRFNIDTSFSPYPPTKLVTIVEKLASHYGPNSVVILVDEYDKPILNNISSQSAAEIMSATLKQFYEAFKGIDRHIRAVFITGVTKFAKTSIFSGINNLNDLSLREEAASLLGYTQEEIITYFSQHLQDLATKENISYEEALNLIKDWYNGYRFSEKELYVYNPFSLLYCFKYLKCINHWFESGTPSFLISLIRSQYFSWEKLDQYTINREALGTFEASDIPLVPILYQTGYLTIADYDTSNDSFTLDYPNREVRGSFNSLPITSTYQ